MLNNLFLGGDSIKTLIHSLQNDPQATEILIAELQENPQFQSAIMQAIASSNACVTLIQRHAGKIS